MFDKKRSKINSKKRRQNPENVEDKNVSNSTVDIFSRRIINSDATSCWLNSCLQLLLVAFDAMLPTEDLNSNLGIELKILHMNHATVPLNPTTLRKILTETDNLRIESEKIELAQQIKDPRELRRQLRDKENLKLNLGTGQQCVRDFFVCLRENRESWPDVYSFLNYNVKDTTRCIACGNISENEEREEIYTELTCPPDGSDLSSYIEEYFNKGEVVESTCESCFSKDLGQKRTVIENVKNTQFIIIILLRAENDHMGRPIIKTNNIEAVDDVKLLDSNNCEAMFEPICIVQHQGVLRGDGESYGHYTADVKEQKSSK